MTSKEIATEAAIELIATMKGRWLAHGLMRDSEVSALILSAAAKMVQESGAIEALEKSSKEFKRGCFPITPTESAKASIAALEKLRPLTEHKP